MRRISLWMGLACAAAAGCETSVSGLPPLDAEGGAADTVSADATAVGDETGAVTLTSKADEARYAGVTRIDGDLVVTAQDSAGIRLDDLEEVTGGIEVRGEVGTEASGNLTLPRLTRIGGDLRFAHTHSVGTIDLPNVRTIGGHLDLGHGIFDVSLGRLERLGGDLRLRDVSVVTLDLGALTTIGGAIRALRYSTQAPGGSLELALPSLREVGGDIELAAGAPTYLTARRLAWLDGDLDLADLAVGVTLPSLTSVDGDVRLQRLDAFALDLGSLQEVSGEVLIGESVGAGLELVELTSLVAVGGRLTFASLAETVTLRLPALDDLGSALRVTGCARLTTFSAPTIGVVHSDLVVSDDGQPLVLDLPALTEVGGNLELTRDGGVDARLDTLATVTGDLRVISTPITHLTVPALATVGRHLVVTDVTSNDGTLAFPELVRVGGDLRVARVSYLASLHAGQLTRVGSVSDGYALGDLAIEANRSLVTLGLDALEAVEGAVSVRDNTQLPTTSVEAALESVTAGGATTICGNLDGDACP